MAATEPVGVAPGVAAEEASCSWPGSPGAAPEVDDPDPLVQAVIAISAATPRARGAAYGLGAALRLMPGETGRPGESVPTCAVTVG